MIQPIYQDLSRKLEVYIRDRQITGKMPGLLRLAKELGCHHVTLAKAMRILDEKGIVTIKDKCGTFVNKREERPKYGCIGIFGATSDEPNDRSVLRHLNELAGGRCQIMGITYDPGMFEMNPKYILNFPVDAFLFRGSLLRTKMAELVYAAGIPLVGTSRQKNLPWMSTIDNDICGGYAKALRYLRTLGHRRIGFIEYDRTPEYRYHLDEYDEVLRCELGEDYDESLVFIRGLHRNYLQVFGQDMYRRYAEMAVKHFLSLPDVPTAVLVGLYSAPHLKHYFESAGYRVPEDISIVAVHEKIPDNDEFTGIYYEEREKLDLAFLRLLEIMNGDTEVKTRLVEMSLKVGKTTASRRR